MPDITMEMSPAIIYGTEELARLSQEAAGFGRQGMIICDPIMERKRELLAGMLEDRGRKTIPYTYDNDRRSTFVLQDMVKMARISKADFVIAIGGVHLISLARAVAAIAPGTGSVDRFFDGDMGLLDYTSYLPCIEVPTTGRNPLLLRPECLLTESREGKSRIIPIPSSMLKMIVMDNSFLFGFSKIRFFSISFEIFMTALEAFLASEGTFFSDKYCLAAMDTIWQLWKNPEISFEEPEIKKGLYEAGLLAGFAGSYVAPGAATLLAYCAGRYNKTDHTSLACPLLPAFTESSFIRDSDKITLLMHKLGIKGRGDAAGERLSNALREIADHIGLPLRLKSLDLNRADLLTPVESAKNIRSSYHTVTSEDFFYELIQTAG